VRFVTAQQSAAIACVVGEEYVKTSLVPLLQDLVVREETLCSAAQRVQVAETLMELAEPLGPDAASKVFLNPSGDDPCLLDVLLDDASANSTNLRLAVINKLMGLITVLDRGAEIYPVIDKVRNLCEDKNWRVRWAAMTLAPCLVDNNFLSMEEFDKMFLKAEGKVHFAMCAEDNCALIRTDWVTAVQRMAAKFGTTWLSDNIVPIIEKCAQNKNYQVRAVLLVACANWGPILKGTGNLEKKMLPKAIEMLSDSVPNLKLMAAKALGEVIKAKCVSPDYMKNTLKPPLDELSRIDLDADVDARSYAKLALDHIC